jgi:hypothetical protein
MHLTDAEFAARYKGFLGKADGGWSNPESRRGYTFGCRFDVRLLVRLGTDR